MYNVNSSSYTKTKDTSIQIVQNNLTQNKDFIKYDLLNVDFSSYSHNYNINKSTKVKYIVINNDGNILQYNPSILTRLFIKNADCYFTPLLLVIEQKNDKQIITIIPSTDIYLYYNCKIYIFLNCTGYKIENNNIDITNNVLLKYITYCYDYNNYIYLLNHSIYKYIFYILVKINGSNKVNINNTINTLLHYNCVIINLEELYTNSDDSSIYIKEYSIEDINSECNV